MSAPTTRRKLREKKIVIEMTCKKCFERKQTFKQNI